MYYRHSLDYTYPDRSDEHMISVKKLRETNFDEKYDYVPRGAKKAFLRSSFFLAFNLLAFPVCYVRYGLRYFGKENYKRYKKELKKSGAITVCNHVFMWDYLCVIGGIRPHLPYFPAWKTNLEGSNAALIRMSGGIPIPTDSMKAMVKFSRAMDEVLESGKWLHVYPEGSLWFYYPDIRPLKKAVFQYAVKYQKPLIPITMSFRPRRGIMKLLGRKPLVDLHIGEPLYADTTLSKREAERKLHAETYHIMQVMNGINPGDPTYKTI